ncbi:MAG: hypothetical protein EOS27_18710 [Mesorhizobium sp.]|nr:MAG: hypothetical protein EOS27_18710 [Mesorhizobium sp.]
MSIFPAGNEKPADRSQRGEVLREWTKENEWGHQLNFVAATMFQAGDNFFASEFGMVRRLGSVIQFDYADPDALR